MSSMVGMSAACWLSMKLLLNRGLTCILEGAPI